MKQPETISQSSCHTAVQIDLNSLTDYFIIHPVSGQKVEGKIFLKEFTHATGTEISVQTLPPQTDLPYFHVHRKNEETYIILKGSGDFQVDENCFPVSEGSVIRVAPRGKRGLRNSSDIPMIYMVIQSRMDSLEEYSAADGERIPTIPLWK